MKMIKCPKCGDRIDLLGAEEIEVDGTIILASETAKCFTCETNWKIIDRYVWSKREVTEIEWEE